MTPKEAYNVIDQATAAVSTNREGHIALNKAMTVILELVNKES